MLVVLEADVEVRLVALDQAGLEDERLLGAGGHHVLHLGDAADQAADLGLQAVRRAEVGAHAAPEGRRLPHVDHPALDVAEDIDAGAGGQGARLVEELVRGCSNHRTHILSRAEAGPQRRDALGERGR